MSAIVHKVIYKPLIYTKAQHFLKVISLKNTIQKKYTSYIKNYT